MTKATVVVALVAVITLTGGPAALAANCADLLAGNTYQCAVKAITSLGEDPQEGSATLTFGDGGDVSLDIAGEILSACTCEAKGSFANPKFGQSKRFNCVGHSDDPDGDEDVALALNGKALASGKRIKGQGVIVSSNPSLVLSFVMECEREEPAGASSD
jgi:hypothetical protein